jgi:hypothetical protein
MFETAVSLNRITRCNHVLNSDAVGNLTSKYPSNSFHISGNVTRVKNTFPTMCRLSVASMTMHSTGGLSAAATSQEGQVSREYPTIEILQEC